MTHQITRNGFSHGIYAADFLLRCENDDDQPRGLLQEQIVRDRAYFFWKKRCLNLSSQLAYYRHPAASAMAEAGRDDWEEARAIPAGNVSRHHALSPPLASSHKQLLSHD
jgi:hypothetical protein